jgi:hypothetical protein
MQQALAYAEALDVPFVFSSNGDAFVFHDRTGLSHPVESTLSLNEFPSPGELWSRYRAWMGLVDMARTAAATARMALLVARIGLALHRKCVYNSSCLGGYRVCDERARLLFLSME